MRENVFGLISGASCLVVFTSAAIVEENVQLAKLGIRQRFSKVNIYVKADSIRGTSAKKFKLWQVYIWQYLSIYLSISLYIY